MIWCITAALAAAAQDVITVSGTVYEPDGQPAIGVSITVDGKPGVGVNTDLDGKYRIAVSPKGTLVVSYIGYETQKVRVDGHTTVNITLSDAKSVNLQEVVIVGYGTQKKINATGAVKTIDNSVLEARPVANAVQGLQGAVAGLNITNDAGGALGESMNINIRGVGSIGEGSSSQPLILIDGMEGDLSTINPNDIENISVLKDAAAASIYGSRAPFGVILVTTKGGEKGIRVQYSGNVRFQQPVSVPTMVDSRTFAYMVNEAYANSGNSSVPFSKGYINRLEQYQRGEIDYATEAQVSDPTKWKTNFESWGNTNWYDVYLKDHTFSQEHNLSVSGGSDKVTYYLSGNFMDQSGLFKYADEHYQRLAITGKTNIKFNKYVSLTWTSRIISTSNGKPSALNALFYHNLGRRYPTIPVYLPNGEYHPDSMIQPLSEGGRISSKQQQFYNQANLTIEPIKGWEIHADISSRIEHNPYTRQFIPTTYTGPDGASNYMLSLPGLNDKKVVNASNGTFTVWPSLGESWYEKANVSVNYFTTNFYTNYALTLKEKHNFKFLLGVQTEYYKTETDRMGSTNVLLDDVPFLPTEAGGEGTMISQKKGEWTSVGIFGRINYNYDDRYMVEINLRGDAASRFPKNQRWGVFPSFSVGWNIGQEHFWEPIATAGWHYFKLRASYGQLGNQNTSSFYPYYQQMSATSGELVLGGQQAVVLPMYQPYSTSLTWERIENAGAGVDVGLMNNRLTGSFDWYQRTTKDMVGPASSLPGVYGAAAPKTNNAELRTRGWELEVAWRDRINSDWSYGISASLSDYKTVVTKYDSADNSIFGWYEGKEYGTIYGYRTEGIAKNDAEMAAWLAKNPQTALGDKWGGGDIMYRDLDHNGEVSPGASTIDNHGDLDVIGNTTPRFAYSFTLEGAWRFIDIRAYFQGIGKRDFFIGNGVTNGPDYGTATFFGWGGAQWQFTLFEDHLNYFRYADSALGANMENPYYARLRYDKNNIWCSDRYVQNASYLRLKNLQIGFSLPKCKLSKYVKKARLYVSGENIFTITKLKILDPEALKTSDADYNGGAGKTYPQYRTWSIGLELTF